MPAGFPVTPETRARAVELMVEGKLSRNAIARELDVSGGLVSKIAAEIGHSFNRAATAEAIAAKAVDIAASKADLAQRLMLEAHQALDDLHAPVNNVQWVSETEHQSGGWKEHLIPEPTASDKRNYMTIVGIAVSKVAELTKSAAVEGSPESIAWMDGLAAVLTDVRDKLAPADMDPTTDPTLDPEKVTREDLLAEYSEAATE